jgi:ABC-type branched-subunit amino acid transport system ATPase component
VTGAPILEVDSLDFAYGPLQVLFGVSFTVDRGESLALLGTNGAGKSTLLRAVCGLAVPTAGRVVFDGTDITGTPAERLQGSGMVLVPGGKAVFGELTVAENLEIQALALRKRRGWFDERLALVLEAFPRLGQRLTSPAATLSGGEQQQLALARTILLDPVLLCIDELSLGLAPIVVRGLIELVEHLQARGTSLLLVEQSLNIAASLCPRAVFMEKGAIRFTGATSSLLENDDIARAVFFGREPAAAGAGSGRPARGRR